MSEREQRAIKLGQWGDPLENLLIGSPEALWRAWIDKIIRDPEMDLDRILRHLQAHIGEHIPNEDAPKERWEEWLAGSYNLLAIVGAKIGTDPPHALGNELLLRKWLTAPSDHTPPPKGVDPEHIPRTRRRATPREDRDYSGS